MDINGQRRFRISDNGRVLEENAQLPPATLLTATLVGKEKVQVPVTPENAYTEDFQDLFQARYLPDIIDFKQRNQRRKSWNLFVPAFMMTDMGIKSWM